MTGVIPGSWRAGANAREAECAGLCASVAIYFSLVVSSNVVGGGKQMCNNK